MKKRIIITSISLVCLIIPSVLVIANNTAPDDKVSIDGSHTINYDRYFKMDIYVDGNLTDDKMSVHLQIFNALDGSDKIVVFWEDVYIHPDHKLKKIQLTPEHYSTWDDTIENVKITQNSFSFIINIKYLGTGRTIQVAGQKEGKTDVESSALWLSEVAPHRKYKMEWRSTDKIILPYTEVF